MTSQRDEIKAYADDILSRYTNEEFDIDGVRASKIPIREPIEQTARADDDGTGFHSTNLALMFGNAISDYKVNQHVFAHARRTSVRLMKAYEVLKSHGCIIDGRATKRRLKEKDDAISKLDNQFQDALKKLGVIEKRFNECWDEKVALEREVAEQKERIDSTRANDIQDSLKTETSKTEGVDEE